MQDINSLNKKIDALAEITHSNDADMMSIADTYTTVQEVNDVLKNYALESEIQKSSVNVINTNLQSITIPYRDSTPYYYLNVMSNESKASIRTYGIDIVGEGEKNINISGHYVMSYETNAGFSLTYNSFEIHFNPDMSCELLVMSSLHIL